MVAVSSLVAVRLPFLRRSACDKRLPPQIAQAYQQHNKLALIDCLKPPFECAQGPFFPRVQGSGVSLVEGSSSFDCPLPPQQMVLASRTRAMCAADAAGCRPFSCCIPLRSCCSHRVRARNHPDDPALDHVRGCRTRARCVKRAPATCFPSEVRRRGFVAGNETASPSRARAYCSRNSVRWGRVQRQQRPVAPIETTTPRGRKTADPGGSTTPCWAISQEYLFAGKAVSRFACEWPWFPCELLPRFLGGVESLLILYREC